MFIFLRLYEEPVLWFWKHGKFDMTCQDFKIFVLLIGLRVPVEIVINLAKNQWNSQKLFVLDWFCSFPVCLELFYNRSTQRARNFATSRHHALLSLVFITLSLSKISATLHLNNISFHTSNSLPGNSILYTRNDVNFVTLVVSLLSYLFHFDYRRAHLRDCLELLKDLVPSPPEHQKATTLALLQSAQQYIKVISQCFCPWLHKVSLKTFLPVPTLTFYVIFVNFLMYVLPYLLP